MKPNITYKSLLSGIRGINKRNEVYKSLTEEQQRKEIAWDVIMLLQKGMIEASDGCYWDNDLEDLYETSEDSKEVFRRFNKLEHTCEVCARGAIMLSTIRLGNTYGPEEYENAYCVHDGVMDGRSLTCFSVASLRNMELEYEYNEFKHSPFNNTDEKLMNIMCNIIVNGDFNTSDKTDYVVE